MNTAFDEALRLLEYAREEIQNCYGEDTDLTDRITCFLGLYDKCPICGGELTIENGY